MKKFTTGLLLLICFACNQNTEKHKEPNKEKTMLRDSVKDGLKRLAFDSKTDLVCGMPVSAGVHDTLTYKGKLYGFCATECKEEFLKDPGSYLSAK